MKKTFVSMLSVGLAFMSNMAIASSDVGNFYNSANSLSYNNMSLYVDGKIGLANNTTTKFIKQQIPINWKSKNYGLTWGSTIGCNLNKNIAVEVGGFYLPDTIINIQSVDHTVKAYNIYTMIKLSAPIIKDKLSLFTKGGFSYNHGKSDTSISNTGYVGSIGGNYNINKNLSIGLEYIKFASDYDQDCFTKAVINPGVIACNFEYTFSL